MEIYKDPLAPKIKFSLFVIYHLLVPLPVDYRLPLVLKIYFNLILLLI